MKQEIAELWAKDLIEGGHSQTTYGLRRRDSFCCLGRLCELHRQNVGGLWGNSPQNRIIFYKSNEDCPQSMVLPNAVRVWAGMRSQSGAFEFGPDIRFSYVHEKMEKLFRPHKPGNLPNLSWLNDNGASFQEIGHFIRLNWKFL